MNDLSFYELIDGFGIKSGDVLDIASDMASIAIYYMGRHIKFDANAFIDTLKEAVGEDGTVMIRTFNWDFCHGTPFDINNTPGKTGALGNIALKRDDFRRTGHPIYSWMIWGKDTDQLINMDNVSAFGEDTPFDYLYRNNGIELCIGNTNTDACTQLHHAETVANVPYRFNKPFTGAYTDVDGNTSEKTYTMPVRPFDVSVVADEFHQGERLEFLENKGIIKSHYLEDKLRTLAIDLHKMQDFVVEDLIQNDGVNMISVDGLRGYKAAGIDYSQARFF